MKYLITLFCCCLFHVNGQTVHKNDFLVKVKKLKTLVTAAENMLPGVADSLDYNVKISKRLSSILADKRSVHYDLDKLLKHDFLDIIHSDDKRLWFFSWFKNTGGTFKASQSIMQYRTKSNLPAIALDEQNDDENNGDFNSVGSSYHKIIKLNSKKNIYLCMSSVVGCSTCCSEIATVFELKANKMNFDYPAFTTDTLNRVDLGPMLRLDCRCGDITFFEYDKKSETLSYEYTADDNTPIKWDEEHPEKNSIIRKKYHWNGAQFIEVME